MNMHRPINGTWYNLRFIRIGAFALRPIQPTHHAHELFVSRNRYRIIARSN